MPTPQKTILAVGATGSIGRLVVAQALDRGYRVRALVRDPDRARRLLPAGADLFLGKVTEAGSLTGVTDGVDAVSFTLGASGRGGDLAKRVDYGGVLNVLRLLGGAKPRIALMTAIGVTKRVDERQGRLEGHDWKRRSERLVRASGCPYTIVRPGWFDYNEADQQRLMLLQGDRRWASDPSDGVVARQQIAQVIVESLLLSSASRKTLELVAEQGEPTSDLDSLFASLVEDSRGSVDGIGDVDNMPFDLEPGQIRDELESIKA